MRVRKMIGGAVLAAAAVGALTGVGAGLASAGPNDGYVDVTIGDDGLHTVDLGVEGQEVIVGGTYNF